MTSGGGNFEGADCLGLSSYVVEVDGPIFILTIWLKLKFMGLVEDRAVEEFDNFEE